MRWWPFGRRNRAEAPAAPAGEPPATTAVTAPRSAQPPTNAWRQLPPLRSTPSAFRLTAPVQRLQGNLAATHHTQVSEPTLVHDRTPAGPTGTATGIVRPHGHRTASSDTEMSFAVAPAPVPTVEAATLRRWDAPAVQRLETPVPPRPVGQTTLSGPAPAINPPSGPSGTPAAARSLLPPPSAPPGSKPGSAPGPVPGVRASDVFPEPTPSVATPGPAPRRMPVRAAPVPRPEPASAVQRLPIAAPESTSTATAAATAGPTRTAPAAGPTETPTAPPDTAPSRSVGPTASRPDRPGAPILGSTRIVRRVGAPMTSRPASMVDTPTDRSADRTPGEPSTPAAGPAMPLATPPHAIDEPRPAPGPQRLPGELPARAVRPVAPATRSATTDAAARRPASAPGVPVSSRTSGARTAPIGSRATSIQRLPSTAPSLTVANASGDGTSSPSPSPTPAVPVRRGIQRAPESVPPSVRSELEPQLGDSLGDVRVHRGPEVGEAARSIQAKAFATGGEVFLPDEHGPTSSGEGRKILSHELTHVVQQRRMGGSLPEEGSAAGAALEREAREVGGQAPPTSSGPVAARKVPAAAGARPQRLQGAVPARAARPMPVVEHAAGGGTPLGPADQAAIVAQVQAAATSAGIPSTTRPPSAATTATTAGPGIQRLPGSGATATPQPTPTGPANPSTSSPSMSGASGTSRTSAPAPPTERSTADLDKLATQLYPRLRSRLRTELLTDRERSGRLFDRG